MSQSWSKMLPTRAQIAELALCLKDIRKILDDLVKCQECTCIRLQTAADAIDNRYTWSSILIMFGTFATGYVALPYLGISYIAQMALTAVVAPGAGEAWNFFWEYKGRKDLKKNLDECICESRAQNLKRLQEKWESLMKNLSIVFPGVDNNLMVDKKDKTFTPDIQQSPFWDTVQSRLIQPFSALMKNVTCLTEKLLTLSIWLAGVLESYAAFIDSVPVRVSKIVKEDGWEKKSLAFTDWIAEEKENISEFLDNTRKMVMKNFEHDDGSCNWIEGVQENMLAFLKNAPTPEGKKLRRFAEAIEKVNDESRRFQDTLIGHPGDPFSKEGLHHVIKKSDKFEWSLEFDEETDCVNVDLTFDEYPLFRLKPEGNERAICPIDKCTYVFPIMNLDISQIDGKERARIMVDQLLNLQADVTGEPSQFNNWLFSITRQNDTVLFHNYMACVMKMGTLSYGRQPSRKMETIKNQSETLVIDNSVRKRQVQETSASSAY